MDSPRHQITFNGIIMVVVVDVVTALRLARKIQLAMKW
jgi:hypothetical protein